MIPLRDENPASSTPVVTRALIALNALAFLFELSQGGRLGVLVNGWGLVPGRVSAMIAGLEPVPPTVVTVFTSMFLHGGWVHLIGNMWYLWIFGDNVEDRCGRAGFLAFYLGGGAAAAAVHVALNPWSPVPTVGASGAIAAVLGAYAVLFPRARVLTLVPVFFFLQVVTLPALLVLGLWFVVQFFSGALTLGAGGGGVAWWAHIGGFAFGMLVALALRGERRSRAWVQD